MALSSGTKFGPYEILSPLGTGGMGEVYRARDTRLNREVALKVLPEALAADAERMARFSREAQVLASLNHPHIATIHRLEESGATRALVMELVEGPTLAERIAQGPVSFDEALPIARQIAEALEYAHEKGIIHRDLKPANVKVSPDGGAKILDFGLAKALETEAAQQDISHSPTLTMAATQQGIILGTAAYMSPEQARGKSADRRADIWAFGCVLFEMLTGKQAFGGETVSDTLAAVIRGEPDWKRMPEQTPAGVRRILRRCLNKDPRQRLQAIGDARILIEEVLEGAAETEVPQGIGFPTVHSGRRRILPWALAGLLGLALIGSLAALWLAKRAATGLVAHLSVAVPAASPVPALDTPVLAISPDGQNLVYVAGTGSGAALYLRPINSPEAKLLSGTEGARDPFFSPDGRWVGFFAGGKMVKVSVEGGSPIPLCDATNERGASWAPDHTIYFSPTYTSGLMRVSDGGGTPESVIAPNNSKGERSYRWPQVLPGGEAVLFTVGSTDSPGYYENAPIVAVRLKTGERHVLLHGASMARYVKSGQLIYARGGVLYAVAFNLGRLEVSGTAIPVLSGVGGDIGSGAVHFASSDNGTLAYVPRNEQRQTRLIWMNRQGQATPIPLPPNIYATPSLSPDGKRLAVTGGPGTGSTSNDVWIVDLQRDNASRLTFEGGKFTPIWTRDGKRVTYTVMGHGGDGLYWKAADGSSSEQELVPAGSALPLLAGSWGRDDKVLVFTQESPATRGDIMLLPMEGDRQPKPFLETKSIENAPAVSPDGHWIAYVSDETGRDEVYVQNFPGPGGKWQVSSGGGRDPAWRHDGKELYYLDGDRMMVVTVNARPTFSAGTPRQLFQGGFLRFAVPLRSYDVSADGQKFVMVANPDQGESQSQINVILNWFEELKRLTAAPR